MGIREKIPYRNHARRHLPGGSDPLTITGSSRGFANAVIASNTVTTPWTYNACVPFNSYSEAGLTANNFAEDSSNKGIQCITTGVVSVIASLTVSGSGSTGTPKAMRLMLTEFTPGSPATTNVITSLIDELRVPGFDNELPLPGYYMSLNGVTGVFAGSSYGLGLQAAGAAANWVFTGSFQFNFVPLQTLTN